jgi:hypothetical protein
MSRTLFVAGLVLSLSAFSAPLQAAGNPAGQPWKTLEHVIAQPDVRHAVRVNCDRDMWPTRNQVALHTRTGSDEAESLRRQIRASGRATCAQGFTHALVVFKKSPGEVAVAAPACATLAVTDPRSAQ